MANFEYNAICRAVLATLFQAENKHRGFLKKNEANFDLIVCDIKKINISKDSNIFLNYTILLEEKQYS